MVGNHVAGLRKPEQRNLREHFALEGDRIRQNDVECRQAIRRDDQQMLRIHIVNVAHLSLMNLLETAQARLEKRCRLRYLLHACVACRLLPLREEGRRLWRDTADRSTQMGWNGAFFGAVIGLLATRSAWGAVLGAFIGILVEQSAVFGSAARGTAGAAHSISISDEFFRTTFELMGHVAKSDGRVSRGGDRRGTASDAGTAARAARDQRGHRVLPGGQVGRAMTRNSASSGCARRAASAMTCCAHSWNCNCARHWPATGYRRRRGRY